MLLLDVIVFDYVYALGASRSASYYYHPEVVVAACVPVGDTGAMRLAAAAAAAAAVVAAACVPERGTEEKGLVLLTPPTQFLAGFERETPTGDWRLALRNLPRPLPTSYERRLAPMNRPALGVD